MYKKPGFCTWNPFIFQWLGSQITNVTGGKGSFSIGVRTAQDKTEVQLQAVQALFNDQRMEKQELKFINQFPTLTARGICF